MAWQNEEQRREADQRLEREIARRRERGEAMEPLRCEVRRGAPCCTFWGRAWCDNLEAYSDFGSRLPRGRSYLRGGRVLDLDIMESEVFAYVAGSELYEVSVFIEPIEAQRWRDLKRMLAGKIANLVDLLGGRLSDSVLRAITDRENGIFPEPERIRFDCSCPDYADMCKHVAAVLYAVGVKLDQKPGLFFTLRKVDQHELISAAGEQADKLAGEIDVAAGAGAGVGAAAGGRGGTGREILKPDELAEIFGIELADPESAFSLPD